MSADTTAMRITRDGVSILEIPLQGMVDSAVATRTRVRFPTDTALRIEARNGDVAALAVITQISYHVRRQVKSRLSSFDGELFLKLPK